MQDFPVVTQEPLVFTLAAMQTIHDRIKQLREKAGLSMEGLGKAVGVAWQTVQQWENGKTAPKRKRLELVAATLGTTVDFLLTGGASAGTDAREIDLDEAPDTIKVRKVFFRISAGIAGFAVEFRDNGEGAPLYYPKSWAEKNRLDPAKLYAVRVSGCSMEPTLQHDDVVVIDTGNVRKEKDAICAVNHEGEFTVKRLKYEHRRWWLVSDNSDQKTYPPRGCTENTFIIGRVVRLERDF